MTTLAPFKDTDRAGLLQVAVHDTQVDFSGQPHEAFDPDGAHMDIHIIRHDGEIVGMFRIDPAYAATHPFADPADIGLRMFLIDHKMQGRGIGLAACLALPAYLRSQYPAAPRVVLTVNENNPAARAVYIRAGFRQWPAPYLGGRRGPQHILSLPLSND